MTNGGGQSALKLRVGGFHSPRKQLFCSPRRDTAQCSPLSMLATLYASPFFGTHLRLRYGVRGGKLAYTGKC